MCLCLLNSDELCLFVMLPSVASNDTVPCVVFVKDEFRLSVDVLFFLLGDVVKYLYFLQIVFRFLYMFFYAIV